MWMVLPVKVILRRTTGAVLAGGVLWRCLGSACATTSSISGVDAKTGCRKLVKEVGRVTAFTAPAGAMGATELDACNS